MTGTGRLTGRFAAAGLALMLASAGGGPVRADSAQTKQAIAEAAAGDKVLSAFYLRNGYDPIWTGRERDDRQRRRALLRALDSAGDHGLPAAAYDVAGIEKKLKAARSGTARGRLDVELSKLFLVYARDISTGVLTPRRLPKPLNEEIVRRPQKLDLPAVMEGISTSNPDRFIARLAPRSPEYNRLMAAKIELEKIASRNAWGPEVKAGKLRLGDKGPEVVALRNRLVRMGFMQRTASSTFDERLHAGVLSFQAAHGLATDGIVGPGTLRMLNTSPETRIAQVIVALERERWMNFDRGHRFVEVNIPDFKARLIENGKVVFETRAVVGQAKDDQRTPEFSDEMEYLVFNPSWNVPRSIATKEYLPMLQEDRFAVSHLDLLDDDGQPVDRASVDFTAIDEDSWNFWLKEPPSQGNALGLVKFMLPNRYNIYLHDTPAKSLFARETRAFSHGCIRLADPFGFADVVLSPQSTDTADLIRRALATDGEYYLDLTRHLPVHLIYRTARVGADGQMQFRNDIYGRDRVIFSALQRAGVQLMSGNS